MSLVMSVPRAALFAAPALIVFVGSYLIANHAERRSASGLGEPISHHQQETIVCVSAEDEERLHRIALKQETAIDLLNGRLTLDEAVMRFVEISSSGGDEAALPQMDSIGLTERERFIHQVIAHARSHVNHGRGRYDAALARLEMEANAIVGANNDSH
jgi:hypothetical protein